MASNPMQRKARTSFLLGVLVSVIILGAVIGFLLYQIYVKKEEEKEIEESKVTVYVLNTDVKSGELITSGMYRKIEVIKELGPTNAINTDQFVLTKNSQVIYAKNNNGAIEYYYILDNGVEKKIFVSEEGRENIAKKLTMNDQMFYKGENNQNEYIEISEDSVMAKTELGANTILTGSTVTLANSIATDDIREVELNMVVLPTYLEENDYIDIRLSLPSGEDYIVVSKKRVKDTNETTEWVDLSETEIITLSNSIVEAYQIDGTKLYAVRYTEPGIQETAETTYVPSSSVINLISINGNIVEEAKKALANTYRQYMPSRNVINDAVSATMEGAQESISSGVQASIEAQAQQRADYLTELKSKQ